MASVTIAPIPAAVVDGAAANGDAGSVPAKAKKLHGREFYKSIGSPKFIVAPMVDQSEFVCNSPPGIYLDRAPSRQRLISSKAWRMLTRSFLPESQRSSILAYSPMFHARLFAETQKYREGHLEPTRPSPWSASAADTPASLEPHLDGNPKIDRPLFVQFCANDPDHLLAAAKLAAPYCDAVDINFGCPQGIARKGHYGAFLQEDQELVFNLINNLHKNLDVPVTAKIRILETKEATLAYAQNVLKAGASILTVHGRRREQKGHLTGLADWKMIKFLRDNLPPETVLFANGNILQPGDLQRCLDATGADGVMSAEGNLSDPGLFAPAPEIGQEGREYWRGKDGRGGWRVDAVMRRYLDILHQYAADEAPPARRPLFVPGDDTAWLDEHDEAEAEQPDRKRRKRDHDGGSGGKKKQHVTSPNLVAVQPHLFHLLRHFVARHTDVRDRLARSNRGSLEAYEQVLDMVERKVARGLIEYEQTGGKSVEEAGEVTDHGASATTTTEQEEGEENREDELDYESSVRTVRKCKRPWWVAQPIVRPLPKEAEAKGAIQLSKKDKKRMAAAEEATCKTNGNGAAAGGEKETRKGQQQPAKTEAVQELEKTTDFEQSELVSG
ncbi:uncharacterized protein E0L32_009013 [Thyridium curvatum]|uniref:tRNA-dihydrouridine(16/17) synthase [NAD(P)(+)] n=1 Tax=Thyridium curvatum TaxID=1093900 RepID=A0A507AK00_9PEZI|nr:uncharacterized protein E0L32_009013 [Thyridium curvatum]TPX09822.1 hypothetical protein E0L32_009013 [Thyridium curvatum]